MKRTRRIMLPVVCLFLALVLLGTRTFDDAQAGPLSVENVNRIIGLVGALGLAFGVLAGKSVLEVPYPLRVFSAYTVVCLISALFYSEWVLYSLWKAMELVAALLVGIYVATLAKRDPGVALSYYEYCLKFYLVLLLLAILGIAVYGGEAFRATLGEGSIEAYGESVMPYQLQGKLVAVNPNSLGGMSGILVYVYLLRLINGWRRKSDYVVFFLCACVFVSAQSRTAWVGVMVSIAWYVLFSGNPSRRVRLYLSFIVAGGLAIGLKVFVDYLTRGVSVEQMQNLSGRALWWEAAWTRFQASSPDEQFFGLGFMTANRKITTQEFGYAVSSLHSDYADALISTGYIGLICMCLFVLSTWFLLLSVGRSRSCLKAELTGIMIILTIRSFTGTTLAIFNFFMVIFFAVIVLCVIMKRLPEAALPIAPRPGQTGAVGVARRMD